MLSQKVQKWQTLDLLVSAFSSHSLCWLSCSSCTYVKVHSLYACRQSGARPHLKNLVLAPDQVVQWFLLAHNRPKYEFDNQWFWTFHSIHSSCVNCTWFSTLTTSKSFFSDETEACSSISAFCTNYFILILKDENNSEVPLRCSFSKSPRNIESPADSCWAFVARQLLFPVVLF